MIKADPWEANDLVLSERHQRIAENAHYLWQIYCIAHKLSADDDPEEYGLSFGDKDRLVSAILEKRQFIGEIWDE